MKVKKAVLSFHNVISMQIACKPDELESYMIQFKVSIIKNGLYPTGPIFYQVDFAKDNEQNNKYFIYIPINQKVSIKDLKSIFYFDEHMELSNCLMTRHSDLDISLNESYDLLEICAKELNLTLKKPYYNICLDVYGEMIIDVFAPIEEEYSDK